MCELLVGLPDVDVVGVDDPEPKWLVVVVAPRESRPSCGRCGTAAWVKDRREVDLVDLPAFDQAELRTGEHVLIDTVNMPDAFIVDLMGRLESESLSGKVVALLEDK